MARRRPAATRTRRPSAAAPRGRRGAGPRASAPALPLPLDGVRTYPLKDRAGVAIANAYLVCFEEAANGDYQDYVFTLSNVTPVAP